MSRTKPDVEVDIFVLKMRIQALNQRIQDQKDFIKRCQAKQRSGKGLVPDMTFNSLASGAKDAHKKKKTRRKKSDVWHNYFTWTIFNISPHDVISHAETRIKECESALKKIKELAK